MTRLTLLLAFLFVFAASVTRAQYSSDVFDLKKASDLYDERGYSQNSSISVDGNLIISNSNGNVSYRYPLTSWAQGGYNFNIDLNYCGSVGYSTFSQWASYQNASPYQGWTKFHQNRPTWLVGFNGFAVQSISMTLSYHPSQSTVDDRYNNTLVTEFNDDDFVWALDGYDFCNRMVDFSEGDNTVGGTTYSPGFYRDVIRILRSDGSVMELMNVSEIGSPATDIVLGTLDSTKNVFTGFYVHNEANQPGFGYVEYQMPGDVTFHWEENGFLVKYGLLNVGKYRPRKLT